MSMQYQWEGNVYRLVNCTKEEIPSHSERVLSYWEQAGEDPEDHYEAMRMSVDYGIAFKIVDANDQEYLTGYFTYYRTSRQVVLGHVFWSATKFAIAMAMHHAKYDLEIDSILIVPLEPNFIAYSFLVDDASIKLFHAYHEPAINRIQPVIISMQTAKCKDFLSSYFDTGIITEL